jgi:hypothetical protein
MPVGQLAGEIQGATLLNLSRKGLAIVVPASSILSRGGVYRLTLWDLNHAVDVEGQIRWVRADAEQRSETGDALPIQIAGLSIRKILTPEPQGTWRQLIADPGIVGKRSSGSGNAQSGEPKPARVVEMVTPLNGVDVDDSAILVTCKLSTREEVSSVSINGVETDLAGCRATAMLELEPGLNSLRALVWRRDGSYRSYFLGRVNRKTVS